MNYQQQNANYGQVSGVGGIGGYGVEGATAAPASGLLLLAERVAEATQRVMAVSDMLNQIALGIHGPRPAEVGKEPAPPQSDSMRSRIDGLLSQIARLESAAQSVAH